MPGNPLQTIATHFQALPGQLDAHAPDLLRELARVIVEDNRRGVLAGLDKDGNPLAEVTYRKGKARPAKGRTGRRFGVPVLGHYLGPELQLGNAVLAASPGAGNLTPAEYRKLTGPPLAPRGARSRSIANLIYREAAQHGPGEWVVTAGWVNVVSKTGVPILAAHFEGAKCGKRYRVKLKVRDLRGVRPRGMAEAGKRTLDWAKPLLALPAPSGGP